MSDTQGEPRALRPRTEGINPSARGVFARCHARLGCPGRLGVGMLLLALTGASMSPSATADVASPPAIQIQRVEIGFSGHYKLGYWTPVTVALAGVPGEGPYMLELTVPDGDGAPSRFTCIVPGPFGGGTHPATARLVAKIGRSTGEMTVVVREEDHVLARRVLDLSGGELPATMAPGDWLVLTLGRTHHLADLLAAERRFQSEGGQVAALVDVDQLPQEWYAYQGVDAIVVSGSAAGLSRLLAATDRMAAIDQWLRRGGMLVTTIGAEAATDHLLSPGAPLARWVPGHFDHAMTLTKTESLERFSGVESPLESLTEGEPLRLNAARLVDLDGLVLCYATERAIDLPLVVEGLYGFGKRRFIAIDLDKPLFTGWNGTASLLERLLMPSRAGNETTSSGPLGEVTHAGYTDLSGQLRAALDQFQTQGVRLLPFGVLFAIVFAYIALLGPGDYLLLKYVLRRMEATWITFPLLVVVTCGGAYELASWMKGSKLHVNQLDMLDYDTLGRTSRATTWFTIFSPRSRAYDLSLTPAAATGATKWSGRDFMDPAIGIPDHGGAAVPAEFRIPNSPALLSWFGLPGTALGGMQSRATSSFASQPYDFEPGLDGLAEVPISIWSTKSFVAQWVPGGAVPVVSVLAAPRGGVEGLVSGSITNQTPVRLDHCLLLTSRVAYQLGTLEPLQRLVVDERLSPRSIGAYLRRRELGVYDPYDLDISRIVETMTFYEAAGGQEYTRLDERYEQFADLSDQLRQRRAVFLGFARATAAEIRDHGQPLTAAPEDHWTVYRVVLRVTEKERVAE